MTSMDAITTAVVKVQQEANISSPHLGKRFSLHMK